MFKFMIIINLMRYLGLNQNEHLMTIAIQSFMLLHVFLYSLINFVKDRPGHDFRYAIDNSKIKNKLGWQPKYSFKDGLYKTIKWYCDNKSWYQNLLKSDSLNRLGVIK